DAAKIAAEAAAEPSAQRAAETACVSGRDDRQNGCQSGAREKLLGFHVVLLWLRPFRSLQGEYDRARRFLPADLAMHQTRWVDAVFGAYQAESICQIAPRRAQVERG